MPPDQWQAFQADVAANGLEEPITVTSDDVVLDGLSRLQA
jgi:hypothetical protein